MFSATFRPADGFSIDRYGNWAVPIDGKVVKVPIKPFQGGSSLDNFSIVPDAGLASGYGISYFLGQQPSPNEAGRIEHKNFFGEVGRTYVSQFSLKLNPASTPTVDPRPDGGRNFYILRQWWQQAPYSPPISLQVPKDENRKVDWVVRFTGANGKTAEQTAGSSVLELGKWYHFRVTWRVAPDQNGMLKVLMSDKGCPAALKPEEVVASYNGPIGFKVDAAGNPSPTTIEEHIGIYQGPHTAPDSYHAYTIGNLDVYRLD